MATGDVLGLLRKHWLFVLVFALLGAAAGLVWAASQAPEYSARAEVIITVTSGQTTGELAQGSSFSQQQARNFAALATREIVLAPVIDELDLDMTVATLRRQVSATVPLNTSLISIEARHSSPQVAADIANAAARELAHTVTGLSPKVDDLQGAPVRAQLVETATVPSGPSSPNITLLAVFGFLAGLVAAVALQVASELAVSRIRTTDQLEAVTGLPVLGSISRDRDAEEHPVAVISAPSSLRAEQIRQLRTALKFLSGSEHRVFVFTSALTGEGKSTTSANTAAAFAADGVATCLVEADMRRPTLAHLLDLSNGVGLSDVIAGDYSADEALQVWGPDRLQVMTAGSIPPNPSELLGSQRGLDVLMQLQQRFDVVIIDTPPVTAVTDASVLGRHFGGVVLVVGAQRVRVTELRRAMTSLSATDITLHGTVLNRVKPDESTSPYAYLPREQAARARRRRRRQFPGARSPGRPRLKSVSKAVVVLALCFLVAAGWVALTQRAAAAGLSAEIPVQPSIALSLDGGHA